MNGIRKSHPIKEKIGHKFVGGDDKPVYAGKENLSIGKGTLGMSLRFLPLFIMQQGNKLVL